eukprot:gene7332-7544_t
MAIVRDGARHQLLREFFKVFLTDTEVSRMAPGIQKIVQTRMAQWSKQPGGIRAFDEILTLMFEVIINEALQLSFNQTDITNYAQIFEVWNQGFTPVADPAPTSPYSLGMEARGEQRQFKDAKTPLTLPAMPYTVACIRETLRLSQIVANVPRSTTQPAVAAGGIQVAAKCPFSFAWGGMSVLDPAVKDKAPTEFKPERWLDLQSRGTLEQYQNPFGWGTHECLGRRITLTTCCAIARELVLNYEMTADTNTAVSDFPTGGRPKNGLPLQLKALPV